MTSRQKLSLSPKAKTSLQTKMTVYASGIAAVMALAIMAVFITPGDMEGRLPGYKWRKPIAIDSARVAPGAVLTDFVLLVEMEDTALRLLKFGGKVEISTGEDIRFTAGDGARALPQQIEAYDGKTGRLRAWVQLDTLRQDRPPVLFLYFGNPHPEWALYPDSDTEAALEIPREQPSSDKARWLTLQNNRSDPRAFIQAGEVQPIEAPRPVQIDHFQANIKGGTFVLLEWATRLENRNKTFVIERSTDGKHYQAIGKTSGANTSAELLRYTFADHTPPRGKAIYRLIQIGKDNTYSYSAIARLAYDLQAQGIELKAASPNPFQEAFEIIFSAGQACEVKISLYDQNGNTLHQEMLQAQAGDNRYRYPHAASLSKGTYVFSMIGPEKKLKTQILTKTH